MLLYDFLYAANVAVTGITAGFPNTRKTINGGATVAVTIVAGTADGAAAGAHE